MNKLHIKLAAFTLLFFGVALNVHAQGKDILVAGQGILSTSIATTTSSSQYEAKIGTGYNGTTTLAFMKYTFDKHSSYNYGVGDLTLLEYSDSSYSINTNTCTWNNQYNSGANPDFPNGQDSVTLTNTHYVQLEPINLSFTDCHMDPSRYYKVRITFVANGSDTDNLVYYGTDNPNITWTVTKTAGPADFEHPNFFPMFALTGNGFQITPTSGPESTGYDLSGAQAYCNSAFASSTGIGATIGNGLCVSLGYLFIPAEGSFTQFQQIPESINGRFPFSWIGNMRTILEGANASSSDNFINLGINFGTTTQKLGFTSLTIISTSTLDKYFPSTMRTAAKTLIATALYLGLAYAIYRQLHGIWNKQVT